MRLLKLLVMSLLLFCLWEMPVSATVTIVQRGTTYLLENDFVRVGVDSAKGATVQDYFVKATGTQLLDDGLSLLGDHFWQQIWPGEFLNVPYEAKIVAQGADAVTLEVSRLAQGWAGNTQQNGLKIVRRMTLRDDSPLLYVEVAVENTGKSGHVAGYWSQNIFYANGKKQEKQRFFRPSVRGVSEASYDSAINHIQVDFEPQDGFVRDVQQPWMAALGAESHHGLAFAMSYDELMFLYNCFTFFTSEWQYKAAGIPAGKAWKTDFVLYPISGLPRVDYASRTMVAAVEPQDAGGQLTARLHLAAAGTPLQQVTVSGEYISARKPTDPAHPFAAQTIAQAGAVPTQLTFTAPHPPTEPIIMRFSVTATCAGRAVTEQFQVYFGGKYGKNWQVDGSPLYALPTPERRVQFLKPDHITKVKNDVPKVLVCKGLFTETYLPPACYTALGADVTSSNFAMTGTFPAALSAFPASYEELMALDVIALVNVDGAALEGVGAEMLKDFVEHGGTLFYTGDLWAYDRGNVTGALAALLPVERQPGKEPPALTFRHGDNTIYRCDTHGACTEPLAADAVLVYTNGAFKLKPGAQVLLACKDGTPVLVSWQHGQGRVLALTAPALGDAPAGKTLFTLTPAWASYLASLLKGR